MILHAPEQIKKDGQHILYARVEFDTPGVRVPEFLWFKIPEQYGNFFTDQLDPFLVYSLLAGMFFQEDIQVKGPISPQLAYNLVEYCHLLHSRLASQLHLIEINYDDISRSKMSPSYVGSSFSGGVDSQFTLWKHLSRNQPNEEFQVSHAVFILGFDFHFSEEDAYWLACTEYRNKLAREGIELIPLATNLGTVSHHRLLLPQIYGPYIASVGLALGGGMKRYLIPSSGDYAFLKKMAYTADPLMDSRLSTDTTQIIHHGSTHTRVEKVAEIVDWDLAQTTLSVCLNPPQGEQAWNCSRCEKCSRTMIPIYALNKLPQFTRFQKPFTKNYHGLWWARKFDGRQPYFKEIIPFAKEHKPDFVPWLWVAFVLGWVRYLTVKFTPGFVRAWLRNFGYFVARDSDPLCYESHMITEILRGSDDNSSL